MNATGSNLELGPRSSGPRDTDEFVLADLIERLTTGSSIPDANGLNNEQARDAVFRGEPLEASMLGGAWIAIVDYIALLHFMAVQTPNARWLIDRLLTGEIVRVADVYIRKTPEARRELSKSRL